MGEHIRFAEAKEMHPFLAGLRSKDPYYFRWDFGDDPELNLDWLFAIERIDMCNEAAFLQNDAGHTVSFGIINTNDPPAIHSIYTPPEFRGNGHAFQVVECCVRRIVDRHGRVPIFYDAEGIASTRIKEVLPDGLGDLLVETSEFWKPVRPGRN